VFRHFRSNLVAYLALFVALGGSGYAARGLVLPAHSVGTRQLKNHAVTPAKVARKTIALFKGQTGEVGPRGPQGGPGPSGPAGPSNAYFNLGSDNPPDATATASVSVPAGDYAVYGQGLFGIGGSGHEGACYLRLNNVDVGGTGTNSGWVVQVPTNGGAQTSDEGVVHLSSSGTVSNYCDATGGAVVGNDAVLAIAVGKASP
jgi:hypothetical protein